MQHSFWATVALIGLTATAAAGQVKVDRASPARIQLDAGGAVATLQIEGANLATVTAVRVLRSGREVREIQATFGRAAADTRTGRVARVPTSTRGISSTGGIAISLQAEASASAGRYTLEVVAGRQRIEVPVTISVAAAAAPPPAPTPPSVRSASQTQVTLQAEGPPVTVLLEGALLNDLTDAWVERSGTRMDGRINATLQPPTDSARREVELIAFASAGPPWSGNRQLVLQGSFDGRSVEVPTPVVITVPAPPVDLVISSCSFEGTGSEYRTAQATLVNNGSEGVSFGSGDIMARIQGVGAPQSIQAPGGGRYIPPGGSLDLTRGINITGLQPGTNAVTWMADPNDAILEANATNNGKWCPFEIEPPPPPPPADPLPDLYISDLSVNPHGGPPGTTFVAEVVIRNTAHPTSGVADGSPTTTMYAFNPSCTINGDYVPTVRAGERWITSTGQVVTTDAERVGLGSGESATYTFQLPTGMTPGSKLLECEAEYFHDEVTTSNNGASHVFYVTNPNE